MKYTNIKQLFNNCYELRDDAEELIKSRNTNFDMSDQDFITLRRLFERILYFPDMVNIVLDFSDLISVMESEKDKFEIQKRQQYYIKNLKGEIDTFLTCGRSWKFEDYRCVDWEKRLVNFMLDAKETFFD